MTTSTMEKIKVMLAFDEGKKIEQKHKGSCHWMLTQNPHWNWGAVDYRIAPPPPRKFIRWVLESEYGNMSMYSDKTGAIAVQKEFPHWKLTAFEMTEILDNAER